MIEGFGKDEAAVRYIANNIKPDGIITTKASLVKAATSVGLSSIFRVFMLDSQSIKTAISNIERCKATNVEILPGLIPELIAVCDICHIYDNSGTQPFRIFKKRKDEFFYDDMLSYWQLSDIESLTGISSGKSMDLNK